jgi:hypothetical protein
MSDPDDPFADAERLLRDRDAPGTSGDPSDPMDDFPLIRDAGEKPQAEARRMNVEHDDEFDDERYDAGDFDPPGGRSERV